MTLMMVTVQTSMWTGTPDDSYPLRTDPTYRKIVRTTLAELTEACPEFDQNYLNTLIIIYSTPARKSFSIINGILRYVELPDSVLQSDEEQPSYFTSHTGFIVATPGERDSQKVM